MISGDWAAFIGFAGGVGYAVLGLIYLVAFETHSDGVFFWERSVGLTTLAWILWPLTLLVCLPLQVHRWNKTRRRLNRGL